MKRSLLFSLCTLIIYSSSALAQTTPIIEVRIKSTPTSKDDYANTDYVPCTIRLFNGASFSSNIPVTLRNIPFGTGGEVLFSLTGGADPGSTSLGLTVNQNNSFTTFYIKGRPGYNSVKDKDAVIEVVDNRATNNAIVLARKALMVGSANPLQASLPQIEFQINSVSTLDDYVTWSPTSCSIRLANYSSFSAPVNITLGNMSTNVGHVNFASSALPYNNTATSSTLDLTLPNSGTWVNFFISGRYGYPSLKDKDAIIEILTSGTQTVVQRDTVITNNNRVVKTRDTVIYVKDTLISSYAVRKTVMNGTDSIISIKGTVIRVRDTVITVKTSTIPHTDTVITTNNVTLANGVVLSREALMVRVRKNANNLSAEEQQRFLNALSTLNNTFNSYQTFVNIHMEAAKPEAHDGPGFLAWHRAYILNLERKLQTIDPGVSLPYWKFDAAAPNLFSLNFLGSKPTVSGDTFADFNASDPLIAWNVSAGSGIRRTTLFDNNAAPSSVMLKFKDETATLALGNTYSLFRAMEVNPHGHAHNLAGSLTGDWLRGISTSVNDPLFFLLHSNVDRLWAKWQWLNGRFDAQNIASYSPQGSFSNSGTIHIGHYLNDTMWPWNGITGTYTGTGTVLINNRPTTAPGGPLSSALSILAPVDTPQPFNMIDYKNNRLISTTNSGMGFCYDDSPF